MVVGCECYDHHAVQNKVNKADYDEEEEPKEGVGAPAKANHWEK